MAVKLPVKPVKSIKKQASSKPKDPDVLEEGVQLPVKPVKSPKKQAPSKPKATDVLEEAVQSGSPVESQVEQPQAKPFKGGSVRVVEGDQGPEGRLTTRISEADAINQPVVTEVAAGLLVASTSVVHVFEGGITAAVTAIPCRFAVDLERAVVGPDGFIALVTDAVGGLIAVVDGKTHHCVSLRAMRLTAD